MPSFANDEENAPVLAQPPLSTASSTPTSSPSRSPLAPGPSSSAAAFAKSLAAARVAARPAAATGLLASVDSNVAHAAANVNGTPPPLRTAPPPPSSPPPSPPSCPPSDDAAPVFYAALDAADEPNDRSSTASSSDMIGRGDSGRTGGRSSSTGGAASSHATTTLPDDDLPSDGDEKRNSTSPSAPDRAPPPPPAPQAGRSSPSPSASQRPAAASWPEAPSCPPPPPPPKSSSSPSLHDTTPAARKSGNGGPVSVPSPLVDRTRVIVPAAPPPPFRASQDTLLRLPHVAGTDETAGPADASLADAPPRHSVASTSASSAADAYNGRPSHKGDAQVNRLSSQTVRTNPTLHPPSPSTAAPHRFSSPPLYTPGAGTGSAPPLAAAPPLKHRHTLEVPKPAPARNSREGLDAAGGNSSSSVFPSGRFSPTAVGGGGVGVSSGSIGGGSSIGGRRASLSLMRRNTRSLHSELPRDEFVPDEDALRWAEAYRQKRASKKRRLEMDDDQVLVGHKVDETHQNWVAAYNMLTGIRVSVSRTNAKLDRPLTDEDFNTKQKSTFDIAGNEMVPSAKYDFKFKDYAPWVFRRLRALFHLDPADYLMSLVGKYILSEMGSPGKSGSFFYFSRDYKYIIKTIHHSEHKFLRKILRDYYQHVTENPNTLLSQFFGLHRVKMPYGRKIHFVVMNNLFPPHRDIHQTFDLKGSTIGRDYPEELLSKNPRATMKDLNWLRRHQHLELGLLKKRLFLEQLHRDVALLQRLQIMDYSLLVGTHDIRRGNDENLRGKMLQVFEPGGETKRGGAGAGGAGGGGGGGGPDGEAADALGLGGEDPQSVLMRTPSKLEHMRKTRELRQMLKAERPIPIGESSNKMPDELEDSKQSVFYKDDGGFQSTHQNNTPADEIYYLGVIDCLTHKIEHFWKGLSADRSQISALPPQQYGERFLKFVSGITMSPEDAAAERAAAAAAAAATTGASAAPAITTTTAAATGAAATPGPAATSDGPTSAAVATGREKGKMAEHGTPHWPSHLRHRPQRTSDDGDGTAAGAAAAATSSHRLAEKEAEKASRTNKDEVTKTAFSVGNGGMVVPGLAVVSGGGGGGSGTATAGTATAGTAAGGGGDRRESMQQPSLPMVDEASEASSTGGQSRRRSQASGGGGGSGGSSSSSVHADEGAVGPPLPAKDGGGGGGVLALAGGGERPPTPPASGYLKPKSADSGYGVSGGALSRSGTGGSGHKLTLQLSRESLDKALPPLPGVDGAA